MLIEIHVILIADYRADSVQECLGGKFRADQTMAEIAHLPGEVLEEIFSYLDPDSVMSASLVSR